MKMALPPCRWRSLGNSENGVMLKSLTDGEWAAIDEAILAGRVQLAFFTAIEVTGGNADEVSQLLRGRCRKLLSESPERFTAYIQECWRGF
jgi:hypothetical protein